MVQKPLHVCILIDAWEPFIGGAQVHVKALLKYLPAHNVKITLFHSPHHHIIIRALWCLWVIPQVLLTTRHVPFTLIHAHAFSAGIPAKILSFLLHIPAVFTVHGSHLMDTSQTGLKAWLEKILLTRIPYSHQISVTKSFLNYPNVNKNISVIPNGVDIQAINKVKAKKNKYFTLLYVGRDHPTKGLSILKSAFKQVKARYPKVQLKLITGQLTGTELIKAYKRSHAFVLPSLVEGQPLVLLEAWAAKLPVIATKTAGVSELATHNRNALLIDPGNQAQLTQAIIKLYKMSPNQRKKLALAGYRLAQKLTWEKTAAQTTAVYAQITHS